MNMEQDNHRCGGGLVGTGAEQVAAAGSHGSPPAHEVVAPASLERNRQRPGHDDRRVQEEVQTEIRE